MRIHILRVAMALAVCSLLVPATASGQEALTARPSQLIGEGVGKDSVDLDACTAIKNDSTHPLYDVLTTIGNGHGVLVGWPARFGRQGAKCLYGAGRFSAFGRLAATISEEQQIASADVINGAVGALPISITSMFVTTKATKDSVSMTDLMEGSDDGSDGEGEEKVFVDGLASRVTALARNGGNLTFHAHLPLVVSVGPNVRWSQSLTGGIGLLGDIDSENSMVGSFTAGLEGSLALTIRASENDNVKGSVLIPYRLARVGTFGDIVDPEMLEDPMTPIPDSHFWVIQAGFALTDPNDKIRGGVTLTWPLDNDVAREAIPRLGVNLRLLLPPAAGG